MNRDAFQGCHALAVLEQRPWLASLAGALASGVALRPELVLGLLEQTAEQLELLACDLERRANDCRQAAASPSGGGYGNEVRLIQRADRCAGLAELARIYLTEIRGGSTGVG